MSVCRQQKKTDVHLNTYMINHDQYHSNTAQPIAQSGQLYVCDHCVKIPFTVLYDINGGRRDSNLLFVEFDPNCIVALLSEDGIFFSV